MNKPDTTVEFIDLKLPQGLKISGKGFKRCSRRHARRRGPARLPGRLEGRPAGHGNRVARPPAHAPLTSTSTPFVVNDNTLAFYVARDRHRHRSAVADHGRDHRARAASCASRSRTSCASPRWHRRLAHRPQPDVHGQAARRLHRLEHRLHEAQAQVRAQARRSPTRADGAACPRRVELDQRAAVQEVARSRSRSSDGPAPAGPSSFLDSCAVLVFAHGIVGRADLPIPEALFGGRGGGGARRLVRRARRAVVAAAAASAGPSGGCSGCRSPSTSCSARSACSSFARRPRTPGSPGPRPSATTSRRGWSTSRSGSASRARRCCSATSGGC